MGIVRVARWLVALLAVVVLAGVAGGGVWWLTRLRGWQSSADVIGVVFGVVAAVVTLGVAWAQSWAGAGQARGSRAGNGLLSSLQVPVGPISEIDPTMIGVDRAAQQVLPGGVIPAYVARAIDAELRGALGAAVRGQGPWLVVVSGLSKVGKSRALFEALRGVSRAKCPGRCGYWPRLIPRLCARCWPLVNRRGGRGRRRCCGWMIWNRFSTRA